ncbi:vascular endothelial growth factor receptor 1 isoform X2 [Bemisia tabaci]|uniref:vascular endothelial growth factor receptor 1 isoform X2 n=1 Tax=Bemisia tabaci TaxID=7038 RepID=UPI003B2821C4
MMRGASWCFAFLCLISLDWPSALANVSISPDVAELTIASGADISIRCESNNNVTWEYPEYEETDESSSSIEIKESQENGKIVSVLFLHRASYLDTGFFSCKNKHDLKQEAKIYIYVRDSEKLLAVSDTLVFLTQNEYGAVVIPCRPTSPDVNVSLLKDGEEVNAQHGFYEGSVVVYDPKEGFKFQSAPRVLTGFYECVGTRNNISDSKYANLHIMTHTDTVPKPFINSTKASHIVIGHDVELDCSVTVGIDVRIYVDWILPRDELLNDSRVKIGEDSTKKVEINGVHSIVGHKSLVIKNVTEADQGVYICSVTDHSSKNSKSEFILETHSADDTYLNLTLQGDVHEIIQPAGTQSIQWIVLVAAHPEPVLTWFNPEGKEIMLGSSSSGKYSVMSDLFTTKLVIKNLAVHDSGTYSLVADNSAHKRQLNVSLFVQDRPSVKLYNEQAYYLAGTSRRIECATIAYPLPRITWTMSSCSSYPNCSDEAYPLPSSEYTDTVMSSIDLKSQIIFGANDTTKFTCEACNSFGCENDTSIFVVSDVENGFAVWGPDLIVEKDDVVLGCGASKYDYLPEISWMFTMFDESGWSTPMPVSQSPKYRLTHGKSSFSFMLELTIKNVSHSDTGAYTCVINSRPGTAGIDQESTFTVDVKSLSAPMLIINKSNMNDSAWTLGTGHQIKWNCFIDATPPPTIIWYKDGEILQLPKNGSRIELLNNNQTLLIKYAALGDDGKYTCFATNKAGKYAVTNTLILADKPEEHDHLHLIIYAGVVLLLAFFVVCWLACKVHKEKKLRRELTAAGLINFEEGAIESLNPELGVQEQADMLPYYKKWEFPRDKLKLGKQLGSGAFGVVLMADADGIIEEGVKTTVAVKMVKGSIDFSAVKALASELKIMIHLGKHLNVVNLLGACTRNLNKRELLVIVEYCKHGSLHNYLLQHRQYFINLINPASGKLDSSFMHSMPKYWDLPNPNYSGRRNSSIRSSQRNSNYYTNSASASVNTQTTMLFDSGTPIGEDGYLQPIGNPTQVSNTNDKQPSYINSTDLVCWCFQVARGMEYLASRKVLHGDLAVRNILLADDNIVKICDFGLSKSMYNADNYLKKGAGKLPVKWMAPESIRDRIFSTQSDVWSFGIVIWEMFTLAKTPYPGVDSVDVLLNKLEDGYRLEQPAYAPNDIYSLMLECWEAKPSSRPSFTALAEKFGNLLEDRVRSHYTNLNEIYQRINSEEISSHGADYLAMMSSPSYVNTCPENENPGGYLSMSGPSTSPDERDSNGIELKPMLPRQPQSENYYVNQPTMISGHFNPSYLLLPQSPPPTYVNT